jgi:hypothetical protein
VRLKLAGKKMVSIIENWTDIKGTVCSIRQSEVHNNFIEIEILINKVIDVEGFPNLLKNMNGKTLIILVSIEMATKLRITKDDQIKLRARVAKNEIFAHPDLVKITKST